MKVMTVGETIHEGSKWLTLRTVLKLATIKGHTSSLDYHDVKGQEAVPIKRLESEADFAFDYLQKVDEEHSYELEELPDGRWIFSRTQIELK